MIRGNQVMSRRMRSFLLEPGVHQEKYRELAAKILVLEKERGNTYESIRLTWQEWPTSPLGWEARRTKNDVTNYPIITIPQ
jgi:hypothetical protein